MENQKKIHLNLTVEECNVILDALGNQPFNKVFPLINKIQQQASAQLAERPNEPDTGKQEE